MTHLLRLETHSQQRSNQRRAAPSCCGIAPLHLYRGCCCVAPTALGAVGVMQKQPPYKPNGATQRFSVSAPSRSAVR